MTTRVAVVGVADQAGMAASVARGFESAGCRAELVPYMDWTPHLFTPRLRGSGLAERLVFAVARPMVELYLIKVLRRLVPDLVVFVKCDDLHRSTYKAMRTIIPVVMAFHPDDPFRQKTLLRGGPSHRRALVQMREVDQYLVWSRRLVERAHEAGARRASYIPFACDPMLHHPVPISSEDRGLFAADICFVGNWDAERERWLSELAEEDLALWGSSYWTRCTDERLRSRWKGREVVAHEMAKAVGCARINLNILREQNKDACNMRTFEIPACGGFLLHERSKELAGLLRPGSECDDFSTPNELREKVRYYLQHEDERARIAANGHAGIMRQTYKEWAEQLLQLAESILSERSSPGARASAVRGLEADNPTVSS